MPPANSWKRIRIRTDAAYYDGIATFLLEMLGSGVVEHREQDSPTIILEAYLPNHENTEFRIDQIKRHPILQATPMQVEAIADEPWTELWQRRHPPSVIDGRVIIYRPWDHIPPSKSYISLIIEPSLAFGTGQHETTQLCIQGILRLVKPGMSVLDVGTGSGILAFVSARLGAAFALALDPDPNAIQIAKENRELNQLIDQVHLVCGSLDTMKPHSSSFDCIVANINASVLGEMMDADLASHLRTGGRLLISGILSTEQDGMTDRLTERGFRPIFSANKGEWSCIEAISAKDAGNDE